MLSQKSSKLSAPRQPDRYRSPQPEAIAPQNSECVPCFAKRTGGGFRGFLDRLKISQKIRYGYALAIGIGVVGTTVGLTFGDYQQRDASQQLKIAYRQQYLLSELDNAVLRMRSHPQRLVTVFGNSIWFEYESSKFFADVNRIEEVIKDLKEVQGTDSKILDVESREFKTLLAAYEQKTQTYSGQIQEIWQQIDPPALQEEDIPKAQQKLLDATSQPEAIQLTVEFERLAETLTRSIARAKTQEMQATQKLNAAETLRLQLIVSSMLLSAAIAIILAWQTSRAIARPIRWVSEVAQQVTERANFKLVAPVLTDDEVGVLARSLNQMVRWMGDYTRELNGARATLEQRVEERTRELSEALHELKHTQAQLIQSEKMSSLGQMVAGLAHEINNPVNFIYGNLEHAKSYTQDLLELLGIYQQEYPEPTAAIAAEVEEIDLDFLTEDLPKILTSMKMGTERIREIVVSLRNFSRLDESYFKPVDIHEGLESTLLILNNRIRKGIEIVKCYGDLPPIECYPAQLNQVFMNVLANAIDALQESEPGIESPTITLRTEMLDRQAVCIRIIDNGPGIPKSLQNQLFDPFFTTKPVGKGTGLGLAISYQIIDKHQGRIELFSEPGEGTEFAIVIPIKSQKTVSLETAA
ncbi:sensor histidine kinase [Oxynema aestuarii]|jgi:two-component system NtrC family sensor kinase|uniref:histidine kinase n=1 Tax=Oxynema aestuarii AP17 TaxID=2064643 RepID=A0A6H1TYK7_9CYAN|nr:ATP-binding protein [Oxynema aestuarii]QIZ71698.1 HAMP domain-containing protein [Oxynema aestuarii AP17]RMH78160.1 MAG: HAMP domain-containing protein [Cyanobacteria bacterium J007]